MHESAWLSAHVFHHDDLDGLLVGGVAPLMAELTDGGSAERWFFLRYWDGGNHLRLRVLPRPDRRDRVRELVTDRLTGYLRRHPSSDPDQAWVDGYPCRAAKMARLEGLSTYAERPYANNTVAYLPYRREHDRFGHGESIEVMEGHFAQSSRIALDVVARTDRPQRTTAALAMLLLTASMAPVGEIAAAWWRSEPVRPTPGMVDLARRMRALAARAPGLDGPGALVDWARSLATLRDRFAGAGTAPERVPVQLHTCAHLLCNRLGIDLETEGRLWNATAGVLAALDRDGA
jgi:hypothetical protein